MRLSPLQKLIFFLATLSLLTACTAPAVIPTATPLPSATLPNTAVPTATLTAAATGIPTHPPTLSPTATHTPQPTLSPDEAQRVILDLLADNGGCELPCIWGITVNSSMEDVERFFSSNLGRSGEYYGQEYSIGMSMTTEEDERTGCTFRFYPQRGKVDAFVASFHSENFTKMAKFYSFSEIIGRLGPPTQVWFHLTADAKTLLPEYTPYDLYLFYRDQALLLSYSGSAEKLGDVYRFYPEDPYVTNPEISDGEGDVTIVVGHPENVTAPDDLGKALIHSFDNKKTVDMALGMSTDEFYQKTISGQEPLYFDTPISIWSIP